MPARHCAFNGYPLHRVQTRRHASYSGVAPSGMAVKDYATYPPRGWRVATGMIDGDCRQLVKDRREPAGRRQAVE